MTSRSLFLFAAALVAFTPAQAGELRTKPAAVVELFTSEGCSSCPPADALLSEIGMREDVIALAYHVDYWDYIGWRDTFGSPAFSEYQRNYATARSQARVYTPQLMINGTSDVVGSRRDAVTSAIADASLPVPLTLDESGDVLTISAMGNAAFPAAKLWLVTFTAEQDVKIERGENKGKHLTYSHIVRERHVVGMWSPETGASVTLPIADLLGTQGDGAAIVIQEDRDGRPGRILGGASFIR